MGVSGYMVHSNLNDAKNKENPGLFGIANSNKDFSEEASWGKNQFNNTFPIGLLNYMHEKSIDPVYITLNTKDFSVIHKKITLGDLYGIDPKDKDIYFAFEETFAPYEYLVAENLPRVDVVIKRLESDQKIKSVTPL